MEKFAIVGHHVKPFVDCLHPLSLGPTYRLFDRSDYDNMKCYDQHDILIKVDEDVTDFLTRIIATVNPVVQYEEVRDPDWAAVWRFFRGSCPVLHHKYRNPLNLHMRRTRQTFFDPEELEVELMRLQDMRREHDIVLQSGDVLDVWHEDLIDDHDSYVDKISEFIGGEVGIEVHPEVDFRERIENYDELLRAFQGKQVGDFL